MLALVSIPASGSRPSERSAAWARFIAFELAIWAALYGAYLAVRGVTMGSPKEAFGHAWDVVGLERTLGVFHESAVQQVLSPAEGFLSAYYMLGFGPVIGLMVVWLGIRDRAAYRALRNALLLSIAFATVVFVIFPTAPPRLVGGLAIEDTVGLSSHDTGSFLGIRFNPYAAVPSMHVGWSLLVAVYGFRATKRRLLQAFFLVHPALMAVAVTATGNHFFLDSVGGVAVAGLTLALLRFWHRRRYPRLRAVAAPQEAAPADVTRHEVERRAA
jgi:PAP2 superfamily